VDSKNAIFEKNLNTGNFVQKIVLNPGYIYQESLPWVPPFLAEEPTPLQIGDRVVNIRTNDYCHVPFGSVGTVTAINDKHVEVLFDKEFFGGITCNGRFSGRRGAYVDPLNLINFSM
jgi:membrane-associated protease RseP (regulator of RpoE activity)